MPSGTSRRGRESAKEFAWLEGSAIKRRPQNATHKNQASVPALIGRLCPFFSFGLDLLALKRGRSGRCLYNLKTVRIIDACRAPSSSNRVILRTLRLSVYASQRTLVFQTS